MVILSLDHNNMNLDDTNYDENDPETILYQILAQHMKFEKRKTLKKKNINEELILVTWHTKRSLNFCKSEYEKKEIEPIFTE